MSSDDTDAITRMLSNYDARLKARSVQLGILDLNQQEAVDGQDSNSSQSGESLFSGQRKFFPKIDESKDVVGAVPILKILLKGVEMTEKQSFFFLESYPAIEQFDPHRYNAAFPIPDPSKPSGTVAVVLKTRSQMQPGPFSFSNSFKQFCRGVHEPESRKNDPTAYISSKFQEMENREQRKEVLLQLRILPLPTDITGCHLLHKYHQLQVSGGRKI